MDQALEQRWNDKIASLELEISILKKSLAELTEQWETAKRWGIDPSTVRNILDKTNSTEKNTLNHA